MLNKNIMKKYVITVNGNKYEVEVEEAGSVGTKPVSTAKAAPVTATTKVSKPTVGGQKVLAPMPGNIIKVSVKVGDVVKKGQGLLVFEAMKMENDLTSPADGTIAEIKIGVGSVIAAGDLLVVIE